MSASIYPTGVTIYNPNKCYNGYNIVPLATGGVLLFDMNGNEIRKWEMKAMPPQILPNGNIMGYSGRRSSDFGVQDGINLMQIDYNGNKIWEFDKYEYIEDEGEIPRYMARFHHDFQREGNPVGYYVPGMEAKCENAKTLILGHSTIIDKNISNKKLLNDVIYEIDWEGNIIWQWSMNEHIDELNFSNDIRKTIYDNPNMRKAGLGQYLHINSMSVLGKNKHYDNGDERFNPENILIGSRETNTIMIISKKTGKIVWSFGDDIENDKLQKMGMFIGQHHVHMIPYTLPGASNIIMFDNGSWAGYGKKDIQSKDGNKKYLRDYSRILEFNPITLEVVYEFSIKNLNLPFPTDASKFYSPYVGSVQRLPNGNTLINEGFDGRVFEVTKENEIVFEWISPYFTTKNKKNMIYRAYRYPYEYIKLEQKPIEKEIKPIDISKFRMPNAGNFGAKKIIKVEGTLPFSEETSDLCVAIIDENDKKTNKEKLFNIDENIFKILNSIDDLEKVIKSDEMSYILFGASRCKNCKIFHQNLEEIIENEKLNLNLYFIDVDNINVEDKFNIKGIPVFIIAKNNKELSRIIGKKDYDEILDFIENYL